MCFKKIQTIQKIFGKKSSDVTQTKSNPANPNNLFDINGD